MENIMEVKKVLLWGTKKEFEYFSKYIENEVLKYSFIIVAMILNDSSNVSTWDGVPLCTVEDLANIEYDYIIDMSFEIKERNIVERILKLLNISIEKRILAEVFRFPWFDFKEYIHLKESHVSIIAAHCWGGFAYHALCLPFESPFINLYLSNGDYLQMVKRFDECRLEDIEQADSIYDNATQKEYPTGMLCDKIRICFQHYENWTEAYEKWISRASRINRDNLFFEMTCRTEKEIAEFIDLSVKNKITFTDLPIKHERIINVPEKEMEYVANRYGGNLGWYMCDKTGGSTPAVMDFNLIRLLLGRKPEEYLR